MHTFFGAVAPLLIALLAACASPPSSLDGGPPDSAVDSSPTDSGPTRDGDVPDSHLPPPDSGVPGCPAGEHMCPGGCEDDRPNIPVEGCRNGCDLECPGAPGEPGERPTCTPEGDCTIACEAPAVLIGASCCGGTPMCSMIAAAQCPMPTEEPNETRGTAHDLGTFIDNDSMASITNLTLIDGDEDWYTFSVTDSPSFGLTELIVDIAVMADPGAMEVAMWFECADEDTVTTAHVCTEGAVNTEFGDGCSAPIGDSGGLVTMDIDCEGTFTSPVTDESGTVHVRLRRTPAATACEGYGLSLAVHEEF